MQTVNIKSQVEKLLKIQLIEVSDIEIKYVSVNNSCYVYEIEDLTGANFNLEETIGLRVRVTMFVNQLGHLRTEVFYYTYDKTVSEILLKEAILDEVYKMSPIDFFKDRVNDFNPRNAKLNNGRGFVGRGTVREAKVLNRLFEDTLMLDMYDLCKTYVDFKLIKVNEISIPNDGTITVHFYRDDIYLTSKNSEYAGTFVAFYKEKGRIYGVDGAYKYAVTSEELEKGNCLNIKEVLETLLSRKSLDIDFRKGQRK